MRKASREYSRFSWHTTAEHVSWRRRHLALRGEGGKGGWLYSQANKLTATNQRQRIESWNNYF